MNDISVVTEAAQLAWRLPRETVEGLGDHASRGPAALRAFASMSPYPAVRDAGEGLARAVDEGRVTAETLSGALRGAAAAVHEARPPLSVDVVWTGPESAVSTSRLTSAVVVELIDEAQDSLLLVSYATHDPPAVRSALRRALDRGVHVVLLLERSADNVNFHQVGAPLAGVMAERLAWATAARPAGASLHAKVLVADQRVALVGSANITGHAMERNLECGVLVRGGPVPRRIWDHVIALRDAGVLSKVVSAAG